MNGPPSSSPRLLSPARLLGWTWGCLVIAAVIALSIAYGLGQWQWVRAIVAAAISVAFATALTLRLVCSFDTDPTRQALRLLTAGMVRFFAAIGGAVVSILLAKTQPVPTLISLVPLYLVVLGCESILLHRALWKD